MVKLHIFSNLKERLISSVWMTAFFLLLVGVVHFFHGSREVAYGILLMFAVGCLTEWGYACFLSGGLKGYYIWLLGSIFIFVGGLSFIEAFNTHGWVSWGIIVASSIFTDTCAYGVGCFLGGPKIFSRISPSKTYAGSIGALVLAPILTLGVGLLFQYSISWFDAFMLSVFAQVGDFLQSWAKRHLEVKDSGTWIKGHGGLMDRTDSWWMSAIGYGIGPWM